MKASKTKDIIDVEKDMVDFGRGFVHCREFEDLKTRVKYIEGKLKIESGK